MVFLSADNTGAVKPWWLLPLGRIHPLWWIAIACPLVALDYLTGPKPEFPALFVIPVTVAAWYSGRAPAVTLAIVLPLAHALFVATLWNPSISLPLLLATMVVRSAAVMAVALWLARLSDHERELRRHVQTLEGLLSICAFCKRIRNPSGEWERLESYIATRSHAQFSHSFCAACWRQHYSELGEPPAE
jgi:K+-sensing histidine kinase KdpD